MKTKIQLTTKQLQDIIDEVNKAKKNDSSLSNTVTITLHKECDTHLGSDACDVELKSSYSECIGKALTYTI